MASPPHEVRTLQDLARLAGVTASTVSRALAGKAVVNQETRRRIEQLAAEHSFQPNQMARNLRTRRTGVIGIVVPLGHERRQHLSDPFFITLLGHLADMLTERGYDLMLSRVVPETDNWLDIIVRSGMLDGVLLIGQSDQFAAIERVAQTYRPIVVWGSVMPGQVHCAVGVENFTGGRLAGERLIASGAKALAFMGEVRTLELAERHRGLCAAAAAAGLAMPVQLDTHLASDVMADEIAANLDRVGGGIDAIAAASDVIALATVEALARRKQPLPVVGFDDLPISALVTPRLTTIRQNLEHGARAMVDALFARIAGQNAPSVVMTPELIVRDTA